MLFFYFIFSETKLLQDDILHIQPYSIASIVYMLTQNDGNLLRDSADSIHNFG